MNAKSLEEIKKMKGKTDWERVKNMTDDEIEQNARDDPDTLLLEDCDLSTLRVEMPKGKKQITLRIDQEVIEWFRAFGKGYQTRINAVLKAYMEANKS